jgi:hypothetical protein
MQLVDDRILVPKRIGNFTLRLRHEANSWRANAARQVVDVANENDTASRLAKLGEREAVVQIVNL